MAKRPTTEQQPREHSWSIYHIKRAPATFVGTVDNAPDEQSAIARVIEEYDVPVADGPAAGLSVANTANRPSGPLADAYCNPPEKRP
jgi:hypothetical protein